MKLLIKSFLILLFFAHNAYALNIVQLNPEYFPDPSKGKPIALGDVYVGEPDTDPEIVSNQKTISVQEEDGTITAVSQPVTLGAGGVPLYNGSPVTLLTDGDYSLKLLNSAGSQVYYIPSDLSLIDEVFLSGSSCDLVSAIANASTDLTTIIVDCEATLADGVTATTLSTTTLQYRKPGKIIGTSGGGTETLAINGGFIADPSQQIFGSDLTVTFGTNTVSNTYPQWFGALGDNSNDDAPAFRAAYLAAPEGSNIIITPGTYKFASAATDYAMVIVKPNVNLIGYGKESSIYIADGALGELNVFSWDDDNDVPLGNLLFKDFHIDENGANNVRADAGEPARNNAAINIKNSTEVIIDGVEAENCPGNQVFWVRTPTTGLTDSKAVVKNCYIHGVANDIAGNFNGDHSSSYIQAHYVYQHDNRFIKDSVTTTETAMELHGTNTYLWNNVVTDYYRGAHVVADLTAAMTESVAHHNTFQTRLHAILYWSSSYTIDSIIVNSNIFKSTASNSVCGVLADTQLTEAVITMSVNNNQFSGVSRIDLAPIQAGKLVSSLSVKSNEFTELDGPAVDSSVSLNLTVVDNDFINCASGSGGDPIVKSMWDTESLLISDNNFRQDLYYSDNPIWIAGSLYSGTIDGNHYKYFYDDWPVYFTGSSGVITGITQANPGIVTDVDHGLTDGDTVLISGVVGMTEVNGNRYVITYLTINTYSIVDTSGFTPYVSGGTWVSGGLSTRSCYVGEQLYLNSDAVPDSDVYASEGSSLLSLTANKKYIRNTSGFSNGWSTETSPEVATGTYTINVRESATTINSSGGAVTATLGSGLYVGQIKTIVMTNSTASSTVSITNHQTSDPEVATFDAVDETGVFMWTGTEWITIFATCTFI